ncbi:MAG TPA: hypothetical protein VFP85_11980 [Vicinamibacterales bacterium]|nr:hypothetical protein [Vicinamibacterales bacterium]
MAEGSKVPRKYWWVVAVAVPLAVALMGIVPSLLRQSGGPPAATGGPSIGTISGNNNTVTFDYSTHNTYVTNVNVIAREYELQTGRPLSDELRAQIEAAVNAAKASNHAESARIFEQVAEAVPVPAIYNNIGVAYTRTQNTAAAKRAFELSKAKMAEIAAAAARNRPLSADALKPPPSSGAGVRTESSTVPAMVVEPLGAPYVQPGEIHVLAAGTPMGGSYQVKYKPEPGTTVVMEPGAYDVLFKVSSYGAGFRLATNVAVREGTLTRLNSNALVGGIALETVPRKGFPPLKSVDFIDRSAGNQRLIAQQTDTFGVTLPLSPGAYEVVGHTADGQVVVLAEDLAVRAGEIAKFDTLGQVASIVVHAPNVKGLDMKAIYALKAGSNQIAAKVEAWDVPMLVAAGAAYDIALEQAAGLTRIRSGVKPARGELLEIR